jgi:hypothetical protein
MKTNEEVQRRLKLWERREKKYGLTEYEKGRHDELLFVLDLDIG